MLEDLEQPATLQKVLESADRIIEVCRLKYETFKGQITNFHAETLF